MIEACLYVPEEGRGLAEFFMRGLLGYMWMHGCVFSAAHYVAGHLVVVMYIHSGGVLDKLQASRVMLLGLHCFYIPSPVACGSLVANKGKPWKHHVQILFQTCEMKPLAEFSMRGLLRDMWMHGCVFSAAHYIAGHLVVVMYIHSGGVPDKLQASRVMLLALHCFYIPSPVGHLWPTRANHGSITFKFCCRHVRWSLWQNLAWEVCWDTCGCMAVYSQQPTT